MSKCKYRGKHTPPEGFWGVAVAGKSSHGGNGEICGALSAQGDPCPLCWKPNTAEADCPTAQEAAESEGK